MRQLRAVVMGVLFLSTTVWAQSSGTVLINGTVSKAASIRYRGSAAIGSALVSNTLPAEDVLDATIVLGDIAPTAANNGLAQGATVSLIARSNATYTVTAGIVVNSGFTGAVGEVAFSDFGYGLNNLAASGNGNLATIAGSTVAGAFGNNGLSTGPDGNGQPTYVTTLASLGAAPITVLNGTRISRAGGLFNPNNGLNFDTNYTIVPQYFAALGGFSATVTYTIATP